MLSSYCKNAIILDLKWQLISSCNLNSEYVGTYTLSFAFHHATNIYMPKLIVKSSYTMLHLIHGHFVHIMLRFLHPNGTTYATDIIMLLPSCKYPNINPVCVLAHWCLLPCCNNAPPVLLFITSKLQISPSLTMLQTSSPGVMMAQTCCTMLFMELLRNINISHRAANICTWLSSSYHAANISMELTHHLLRHAAINKPDFNKNFPALTGILALGYFIHNACSSIMRNQRHPEKNVRIFVYVCVTCWWCISEILTHIILFWHEIIFLLMK